MLIVFGLISLLKVKNEEDSKVVKEGYGTKHPVEIQNSCENDSVQSTSSVPMVVEPSRDGHLLSTQFEPEVAVDNDTTNLEYLLQQASPEISGAIPVAKKEETIDEAPDVGEGDCVGCIC